MWAAAAFCWPEVFKALVCSWGVPASALPPVPAFSPEPPENLKFSNPPLQADF